MYNILVTGSKGFIGRYLVKELIEQGHSVIGFDLPENDITNNIDINDIFATNNIKIVIHLAGVAHLKQCQENKSESIKTNIYGTSLLLEKCVIYGVKRFIYISSSYVFSNEGGIYKVTKKACEDLIKEYKDRLAYTIVRCGTVFGVGADENNSVFKMINNCIKDISKLSIIRTTREYIHVSDIVKGIIKTFDSKYKNKEILLSGTERTTTSELFHMIMEILNKSDCSEPRFIIGNDNHYCNTPYSYQPIENEKLTLPSYKDFGAGILEMVEWIENENK